MKALRARWEVLLASPHLPHIMLGWLTYLFMMTLALAPMWDRVG